MKKIFLIALLLGCMSVLVSCKGDLNGDYSGIVPKAYNKVLSIKDNGTKSIEMSVMNDTCNYQLTVIKGGLRKDLPATATLNVLTQAEVDEQYNAKQGTSYKVLPAECYAFSEKELTIGKNETGMTVDVVFQPKKIYKNIKASGSGEYVLPVRLDSQQDSVKSDKCDLLVLCDVTPVELSFAETRRTLILKSGDTSLSVPFNINKEGNLSTEMKLSTLTQQELDTRYSTPEGVNYKVLTSDMYDMSVDSFAMDASVSELSKTLTIHPDKVFQAKQNNPTTVYVLPLKLVALSEFAEAKSSEMLLICGFNEYGISLLNNKSSWKITYATLICETMFGLNHTQLLDGNTGEWSGGWMGYINDGWPGNQNLGHAYFVVDLGAKYQVAGVGIYAGVMPYDWSVKPIGANFYVTSDEYVYQPTDAEYNVIYGYSETSDSAVSTAYYNLHNKIKTEDAKVNWIKVASTANIPIGNTGNGEYWGMVPNSTLDKQIKSRYIKIELIPSIYDPNNQNLGNRSKIGEIYVKTVTSINGIPVK